MTIALRAAACAVALGAAPIAHADYTVEMNAIDVKGVERSLGTIAIAAAAGGGVTFTPNLQGLPPGTHGFHVHQFPNCGAREKAGALEAGALAGDHYDPKKTGKHGGPEGDGHLGDLPPLQVGGDGRATRPVTARRLALRELANHSLVIHAGGDNASDQPKPNGGGGARIACGLVQARVR